MHSDNRPYRLRYSDRSPAEAHVVVEFDLVRGLGFRAQSNLCTHAARYLPDLPSLPSWVPRIYSLYSHNYMYSIYIYTEREREKEIDRCLHTQSAILHKYIHHGTMLLWSFTEKHTINCLVLRRYLGPFRKGSFLMASS